MKWHSIVNSGTFCTGVGFNLVEIKITDEMLDLYKRGIWNVWNEVDPREDIEVVAADPVEWIEILSQSGMKTKEEVDVVGEGESEGEGDGEGEGEGEGEGNGDGEGDQVGGDGKSGEESEGINCKGGDEEEDDESVEVTNSGDEEERGKEKGEKG